MKLKSVLAGLMVILALGLPACTTPVKAMTLSLSDDDFGQKQAITSEVKDLKVGDTVKVTLPSNATTGFRWELAGISDEAIVAQEGESEYIPPASSALGAGGQEIWTFKGLKKGVSTISLEYSRPWEGGTKAEWTLTIDVTVK